MVSADPPVTPDPVRRYLTQLELELATQDAALRHDALIDAESHLRAAIAAGATPERAVADYGEPAEIAAAYVAAERAQPAWRRAPEPQSAHPAAHGAAPSTAGPSASATLPATGFRAIPVIGIWADRRAWGALVYFGLIGFALSLAYFVWAIILGALSIGLSTIIVGVPLFIFLLGSARALCLFEGKVVELFLGVRMPRRVQPVAGVEEVGFWQRIWCWLRDVRSWMSLGYLLGNFPVSVVLFAVTITIATTSTVLLAMPVLGAFGVPVGHVEWDEDVAPSIDFLGSPLQPDANGDVWMTVPLAIVSIALGLALATAGLWLMRGLGWIYGHVVQSIQVARPQPMLPPRA